jgi:hypothetical protein
MIRVPQHTTIEETTQQHRLLITYIKGGGEITSSGFLRQHYTPIPRHEP